MKQFKSHRIGWNTLTVLALYLGIQQGCQTRKTRSIPMPLPTRKPMDFLKQGIISFPSFFSLAKVESLVQKGNLKEASRYVNQSINIEPRNAPLHLLNAFIYESLMDSGQDDCKELLEIAYRTATDLDPSLWLTHYLRGLNALKMSRYKEAQKYFVEAYSLCDKNPDITYSLAYASYYCGDLPVSFIFIEKAAKMCPKKPEIIRSAAMICAASGEKEKAEKYLESYSQLVGKTQPDIALMKKRLHQWSTTGKRIQLMGADASGVRENTDFQSFESKKKDEAKDVKEGEASPVSLVFDATMISYSNQKTESKGQNIFNSLEVVLGGAGDTGGSGLSLSPEWTVSDKLYKTNTTKALNTATTTLAYGLTPVALNYSLNIANSQKATLEIVSRAVVSTTLGHSAYFVQGAQYTGATSANSVGATVASVDAGTKIEIRPISLSEQGEVVLEITLVGSSFMNLPNSSMGISNQLVQTQTSKVSTTVKALLGQTIVISGIQTQQRIESKSGFPLLQSIPIIQYFTSNSSKNDNITSAIFLMTPRLGGNSPQSEMYKKQQNSMAQQLRKRGIMSLGEYSNIHHILKTMQSSQMFASSQMRSGDLPSPVRAYDQKNCQEKISQLSSFLWY